MIKYNNVSKSFKNQKVLENVSFEVPHNEITALVGKNGSGKTTLMRITANLLKPDKGSIYCSGKIGILLGGEINLYNNLTVKENIDFFSNLYLLNKKQLKENLSLINEYIDITNFENMKFGLLSRGMRQKVALIVSFIHNPDILLLDEPSTGLDLISTGDIFSFLKELKKDGKTILISTHNMTEISELSDNIAVLKNGAVSIKPQNLFWKDKNENDKIEYLNGILKC